MLYSREYINILALIFYPRSKLLFDPVEEASGYEPLPEERPGGFNWGEQQEPEQAPPPQDNDPH